MVNNVLQTTTRDIRVSDTVQPAAETPHLALAFVRELLDRYAARPVRPYTTSMILLRRQEPSPASIFQHQTINLAPRLDLAVLRTEPATEPRPRLQPAIQGGRVEANSRTAQPTSRKSPNGRNDASIPRVRPVPRVVRRPQTSALQQPTSAASPAPARATTNNPMVSTWPVPTAKLVDVNRLTDEVVRAIDRRIVAERERLGKV